MTIQNVNQVLEECVNEILATRNALELVAEQSNDYSALAHHFQKVLGKVADDLQDTVGAYVRGC